MKKPAVIVIALAGALGAVAYAGSTKESVTTRGNQAGASAASSSAIGAGTGPSSSSPSQDAVAAQSASEGLSADTKPDVAAAPGSTPVVPTPGAAKPALTESTPTTPSPDTTKAPSTTTTIKASSTTEASSTTTTTAAPTTTAPPTTTTTAAPAPPPVVDPTAGWPTYRINPGAHSATIEAGTAGGSPRAGLNGTSTRHFALAFDSSAAYVLTNPTQPDDQFDWNKLPGLSDCGSPDLANNGLMFAWRWNVQAQVLEINSYWNNNRTHLWNDTPLLTLSRDDLAANQPLEYRIGIEANRYTFSITGTMRGRPINITTEGSRACPNGSSFLRWASGLYFGGTSTAPQTVTAKVFEYS